MDLATLAVANAAKDQSKIVRVTNISNFDFIPEMGAMYGGVPYFVAAGKSLLMPLPVGRHLAKHLARQIMLRNAPTRTEKEMDGKGSVNKLWDPEGEKRLVAKIMTEVYEEEPVKVLSEAELQKKRIDDLNDKEAGEGQPGVGSASTYKDKGEVIAELKKREIPFDARKSKADLEKLLA